MIYLAMGIITNKFYRQVDKELFDLNVFGPVHLSRLIIPHFAERGKKYWNSFGLHKFVAPS